jgi:hypothetical protein
MKLFRHMARLAGITTLLGGAAVLASAASPAASAASVAAASPAATQDGWVRIAHLSPKAPAMDMYLYPFGDPGGHGRAEGHQLRRRPCLPDT